MDFQQRYKEFENFEINILTNTTNVQQFRCRNKNGNGCYRFEVVCTDYAIYVSGDMGELVVQQYGRGLKWLRGSYKNKDYVLSKISQDIQKTKFSEEEAIESIKQYKEDHYSLERIEDDPDDKKDILEKREKFDELIEDIKSSCLSEYSICESLSEIDLFDDGYPDMHVLRSPIEWIYAGLYWFCEELDRLDFKIGESNAS